MHKSYTQASTKARRKLEKALKKVDWEVALQDAEADLRLTENHAEALKRAIPYVAREGCRAKKFLAWIDPKRVKRRLSHNARLTMLRSAGREPRFRNLLSTGSKAMAQCDVLGDP